MTGLIESRDVDFWLSILEHPEVKPAVCLGRDVDLSAILADERVIPFRAPHGGFFFSQLDGLGWVFELHTMFTPEGWGREVAATAKTAFSEMFGRGAQVIITHQVECNWRSQPPRSFGFRQAANYSHVDQLGENLRAWVLTSVDWRASAAHKKMEAQCP